MRLMQRLLIIGLLLGSTSTLAQGLLGPSGQAISEEVRTTLLGEIEEAKSLYPNHFAGVAEIVGDTAELDQRKRGRLAPISAMLKRLGPDAGPALTEVLLFNGPERGELKDSAWNALRAGVIEAAGKVGDARLIPALGAFLNSEETEHYAVRAAAEALGRIRTDEAVTVLLNAAEAHPYKRGSIWAGMGVCRRAAVATYLSSQLATASSPEAQDILVKSLKSIGNAGAWRTSSAQRFAAEEDAIRATAAKALFNQYRVLENGELRDRALKAIVVVGYVETRQWIEASRLNAPSDEAMALDRLEKRLR